MEFLGRHVSLKHNCSREAFLLEKLGIPKEWIFKAKVDIGVDGRTRSAEGVHFMSGCLF